MVPTIVDSKAFQSFIYGAFLCISIEKDVLRDNPAEHYHHGLAGEVLLGSRSFGRRI